MTEQNQREPNDRPTTKSSMSVSQEVVCKDEECIAKVANSDRSNPAKAGRTDKKKSAGSSMTIGGKEICSDEGCIAND